MVVYFSTMQLVFNSLLLQWSKQEKNGTYTFPIAYNSVPIVFISLDYTPITNVASAGWNVHWCKNTTVTDTYIYDADGGGSYGYKNLLVVGY